MRPSSTRPLKRLVNFPNLPQEHEEVLAATTMSQYRRFHSWRLQAIDPARAVGLLQGALNVACQPEVSCFGAFAEPTADRF
jgi:hypothetical protein